jgi:hypothetical protein
MSTLFPAPCSEVIICADNDEPGLEPAKAKWSDAVKRHSIKRPGLKSPAATSNCGAQPLVLDLAGGVDLERIPEVAFIEGSKLRYAFGRVGDVLLEERPRPRCEHRP